jgi:hypothetical protein
VSFLSLVIISGSFQFSNKKAKEPVVEITLYDFLHDLDGRLQNAKESLKWTCSRPK